MHVHVLAHQARTADATQTLSCPAQTSETATAELQPRDLWLLHVWLLHVCLAPSYAQRQSADSLHLVRAIRIRQERCRGCCVRCLLAGLHPAMDEDEDRHQGVRVGGPITSLCEREGAS